MFNKWYITQPAILCSPRKYPFSPYSSKRFQIPGGGNLERGKNFKEMYEA